MAQEGAATGWCGARRTWSWERRRLWRRTWSWERRRLAWDLELGTASAGVGLGVGNGVGWRGTWSWERRRLAWDLELWRGTWSRDEAEERGGHQRATKHSRLTARGEDRSCVTFVPPTLRSWLVAIVLGPASADLSSFALPRRNQPQHAHSCGVGLGVGDVGSSPGRHQKKDSEERRAEHPVMLAHDDEASHRWVVVVRAREPSRACKSLRARVDVCFTDDRRLAAATTGSCRPEGSSAHSCAWLRAPRNMFPAHTHPKIRHTKYVRKYALK
jgi:hypothetical protein